MSFLKNLFGGSDKPKADKPNPKADPSLHSHADIKLHHVEYGRHGDHHSALLGFAGDEETNAAFGDKVQAYTAAAMIAPLATVEEITIGQHELLDTPTTVAIRSVAFEAQMISSFPFLKGRRTLPFKTSDIYRWQNVNDLEAEIEGGGRDTFRFGFFAADWLQNRSAYYSKPRLDISLGAFILVLDEFDPNPQEGGPPFADNFCAYMPLADMPGPTYFSFVSIILDVESVTVSGDPCYILELRLINDEDNAEFFVVDAFLNTANSRLESPPKVGGHVTGAMWLVGEMAG